MAPAENRALCSKETLSLDDDDDDEGADDVSVPFDRASGTSSSVVNSNTLERVFSLPVSGTQKTKSISTALANKLLNLHEQVLVSKALYAFEFLICLFFLNT